MIDRIVDCMKIDDNEPRQVREQPKMPWHTEGYMQLSRVINYLIAMHLCGEMSRQEMEEAGQVIVECAFKIRNEVTFN